MALSLAEIRAKLKEEEERKKSIQDGTYQGGGNNEPNAFLAHWNIEEGKPLNLRFLSDGDSSNDYFWRERIMIKLTFKGIKGVSSDYVTVTVPCNEMFEGQPTNSCPVRAEVRKWYALMKDDPSTKTKAFEDQASKYWGSKSFLYQCMIAPDSTQVLKDVAPENPIRRVLLSKQLHTKVRSILMNTGVKEMPTHFEGGRDFTIIKGKNSAGYATYDESQFSMSERPLNQEERDAIERFGLFNLNEFMPKQPTPEELVAIQEMFEASVNGEAYDPQRWAWAYRPAGVNKPTTDSDITPPVTASAPAPQVAQSVQPTAPVTPVQDTAPVSSTPEVKQEASQPAEKQKLSTAELLAKLKKA